ncbi:hypothetical protein [Rossellomorea marisflavi]|uniref:hypothetical protein n=1 Tax=Rossellomorea marisflavi TaxID=189381 RepID=UPI003FA15578
MKFFEKPKMVTAVVFFIQTMLALLNMSVFFYLDFFELMIALVLFVTFPFMFHHIYSFIINDLDTVDEDTGELKKIPFTLKDEFSTQKKSVVPSKEKTTEVKEEDDTEREESLSEVESKHSLEEVDGKAEELPKEASEEQEVTLQDNEEVEKEEARTTPSRLARKQIPVTDVDFVDDETDTSDEQTPAKPIVVKKAKTHRLERKRLAVEETPADTNEHDKEES